MKPFAFAGVCLVLAAFIALHHGARGRAHDTAEAATAPAGVAGAAAPAPDAFPLEVRDPRWHWLHVDPARAQSERLVATLAAQVALDEDHSVRVTSPVAGRVVRIDARPGQRVEAGQALAELSSSDVGQAQSDRVKAEAAARQSAAALQRTRELYEHHVVALKDLQQAESDDAQARAEADRSRERSRLLGASNAVDQACVLRAPVAGEVLERNLNPGAEVRPDDPNPLFILSDLHHVWITAALDARDVSRVHAGDHLRFTTESLPGRSFDARVTWVSDALDPQTRTAALRAELSNPGGELRAQMPGEVRIYSSAPGAGTVVPTAALFTHGSETSVIVEEHAGRFRRRSVSVGEDDGVNATLVGGLRPGERVVTRGSLLLSAEMEKER